MDALTIKRRIAADLDALMSSNSRGSELVAGVQVLRRTCAETAGHWFRGVDRCVFCGKPVDNALKYACELSGGVVALSARLGCTAASVSQWVSGLRLVPKRRAADIERITDGKVSCEELLPAVAWVRVPDAEWPHPGGRPCVDVARRDEAPAAPEAAL